MIYDLSALFRTIPEAGLPNSVQRHQSACLLAIAERLEALVEAQKPRWVEFEGGLEGGTVVINANACCGVDSHEKGDGYWEIETTSGSYYIVKCTLAEVMAKLRGEL